MILEHKEQRDPGHQQTPEPNTKTIKKEGVLGAANAETRFAIWFGNALVGMSLMVVLFLYVADKQRPQLPLAAQHPPLTLVDEVEHLPPLAWKAIPMALPNTGIAEIEIRVIRGNPIDAFLTTSHELDASQKVEWNTVKAFKDIRATRVTTFRWTGRLEKGGFYLVVRDMTVAVPSTPTSDISVKVLLEP